MQYLVVHFDEERGVIVNGAPGKWMTNEILSLQAGTYLITLAPPPDFTPPDIKVVLSHTALTAPRKITFTKVAS